MSDLGEGDSDLPWLDVVPADNTTLAVLEVRPPGGTPYTVATAPAPAGDGQRWTAGTAVVYDRPGRWVLHWAITGTGAGAEDVEVWVQLSPTAGGPTWTPGVSRVAAYVPHRTLARDPAAIIDSQDRYEFTFTNDTVPTGRQVQRLISDGVDWVTALITPMHLTSQPAAALLAALWAAVAVERSWPQDEQALQRATDMEKRLDALLESLTAANRDANDRDQVPPPGAPVSRPVWSFPPSDLRYDHPRYW